LRLPDKKFTIAILTNAKPGRHPADPALLAHKLVNFFQADKLAPLPVVNTNVSPELYDSVTGNYYFGAGMTMTISRHGPHLFEKYTGYPEQEIFPKSELEFFWKGTDMGITFVKDSSGKAVKLIFHNNGLDETVPREDLTETNVDPAVFNSLNGRYRYATDAMLVVTCEGSHLFVQLTGQPKYEIFPKSETEYFSKEVDIHITFIKDATGKVAKAICHQNGRIIDAIKTGAPATPSESTK